MRPFSSRSAHRSVRAGAPARAVRRSALGVVALAVASTVLSWPAAAAPALSIGAPVLSLDFQGDVVDSGSAPHGTSLKAARGTTPTATYGAGNREGSQAITLGPDTYVDLGTTADLTPASLSTSFWVRPAAAMTGEQVFAWSKAEYNTQGWYLSSEGEGSPLALSVGPGGDQPYKIRVASTSRASFFPTNTWTHVVVTFDAATKQAVFYRNGVKVPSQVANAIGGASTGVVGGNATLPKTLGFNGPVYNGAFLRPALDDYRLYSGAATQTDVVKLFEEGGGVLNKDGMALSDAQELSLPRSATAVVTLPTEGSIHASAVSWTSDRPEVISPAGVVTRGDDDVDVTLTATVRFADSAPATRTFTVTVPAQRDPLLDAGLGNTVVSDAYLRNAAAKEHAYLLSLSSEKFLYWFYRTAGLPTPTTSGYAGWEDGNVSGNFRGHAFGHYMSALAQAYATSQDEATRAALLTQIDDAVDGLAEVQASYAATPGMAGYLAPFRPTALDQVEGRGRSDDPVIVPYYNLHKVLAGLMAIDQYAPEATAAKALQVAEGFGEYVYGRMSTATEAEKRQMRGVEYGGMNDSLYDLFAATGGTNPHFKVAAEAFDEVDLFRALAAGDGGALPGRHSNTTIPKLIGALKRYTTFNDDPELYATLTAQEKTDLPMYLAAAQNFFRIVEEDHTYAPGSNSQSEHFHGPDTLWEHATQQGVVGNPQTSETCNEYNMLKLARELFKLTQDVAYADFYENTFLNTIVSSQDPGTGMATYFQPMAPGYYKLYSNPFTDFWCCVGTAMENFTKLGDSIFFAGSGAVWVNMFWSSTYADPDTNLAVTQTADLPNDDAVTFDIAAADGGTVDPDAQLRLRVPDWIAGDPTVSVNGTRVTPTVTRGYVVLTGLDAGDEVSYTMPMRVEATSTPDNASFVALKYGPTVLSAGLGTKDINGFAGVGIGVRVPSFDATAPTTVQVGTETLQQWLDDLDTNVEQVGDTADGQVQFRLRDVVEGQDLRFTPHYRQHSQRYGLYLNYEVRDSQAAQDRILAAKQVQRADSLAIDSLVTIDGGNNFEREKNLQSSPDSTSELYSGLRYRDARGPSGFFSWDLKVVPGQENFLETRYLGQDDGRSFDVLVDGVKLKTERITNAAGNGFYWQRDAIPAAAAADGKVTVRFQSTGGLVGGVFGIRTMRPAVFDADPALGALVPDAGTLSPAFDPATTSYVLTVPVGATEVGLDLDPHVASGLVRVDGKLIDDTAVRTVDLTPGTPTTLTITSVAQDHTTTRDYALRIVEGAVVAPPVTLPTTPAAPGAAASTSTTVKVVRKKSLGRKVMVAVRVTSTAGTPTGVVQISHRGKVLRTVALSGTGATVKAKVKVRGAGKQKLVATYLGSALAAGSADSVRVNARR